MFTPTWLPRPRMCRCERILSLLRIPGHRGDPNQVCPGKEQRRDQHAHAAPGYRYKYLQRPHWAPRRWARWTMHPRTQRPTHRGHLRWAPVLRGEKINKQCCGLQWRCLRKAAGTGHREPSRNAQCLSYFQLLQTVQGMPGAQRSASPAAIAWPAAPCIPMLVQPKTRPTPPVAGRLSAGPAPPPNLTAFIICGGMPAPEAPSAPAAPVASSAASVWEDPAPRIARSVAFAPIISGSSNAGDASCNCGHSSTNTSSSTCPLARSSLGSG